MFCDIRDFTPLAESQPPEETIGLLNAYYSLMFDAITGQGGIVSLIVGDGLMAIFGAPLPLADPAPSAVRAALEMVELIELFDVEQAAAGKPQIRVGIGVASGEMVAGYTGTLSARPTRASATPSTSPRGSRRTRRLPDAPSSSTTRRAPRCAVSIDVEPLGPVSIRGKAEPVSVFSVTPGQNDGVAAGAATCTASSPAATARSAGRRARARGRGSAARHRASRRR